MVMIVAFSVGMAAVPGDAKTDGIGNIFGLQRCGFSVRLTLPQDTGPEEFGFPPRRCRPPIPCGGSGACEALSYGSGRTVIMVCEW
jgi:hypothetical protein